MVYAKVFLAAALIGMASARAQVTKIACIGNSITAGGYPGKLGKLLGSKYNVENDGVSGTNLIKKGDVPYWTKGKLPNVIAFKPNIITIKLGTNDSKPQNWKYKANFEPDMNALIDTLEKSITPKPVIWLLIPVPAWPNPADGSNFAGIDGKIIANEIVPIVRKVAADRKLPLIDLYTPMLTMKAHAPDGVHPDDVGQDSIAHIIYRALLAGPTIALARDRSRYFPDVRLQGRSLRIDMPDAIAAHLQILDLNGKSLESWNHPAGAASMHALSGYSAGTYLLSIGSLAGNAAKRIDLR